MNDVSLRRAALRPAAAVSNAPLAIGPQVTIVGNVEFDGAIEIDGFVNGEVRSASVNITRGGTVTGLIVARQVTVSGGVSGSIFAEQLVLKPDCDVEGEICYRELALEDGSYFEGKSRPHKSPLELAAAGPEPTHRPKAIQQLQVA